MADLSDVENALGVFVGGVVFPLGVSAIGAPVAVERGWPNSVALDAALGAGKVTVSIYAQQSTERNTTRFREDWQQIAPPAITLTASVSGLSITIGGAVSASTQVVAVKANNLAYAYTALTTDTPATIAAALAALIPGATSNGAVVTLTGAAQLTARVSGIGSIAREVRRQSRGFQIVVWAPTPALRDTASSLIDSAFAGISTLTMPDGFGANVTYQRTFTSDQGENENLYRRDLFYTIEYATTQTAPGYSVAAMPLALTAVLNNGNVGPTTNLAI